MQSLVKVVLQFCVRSEDSPVLYDQGRGDDTQECYAGPGEQERHLRPVKDLALEPTHTSPGSNRAGHSEVSYAHTSPPMSTIGVIKIKQDDGIEDSPKAFICYVKYLTYTQVYSIEVHSLPSRALLCIDACEGTPLIRWYALRFLCNVNWKTDADP